MPNLGYDRDALSMMAHKARECHGRRYDRGDRRQGLLQGGGNRACEQAGIAVTVSKPHTSNAAGVGRFDRADFVYDAEKDAYECPAGRWLPYHYTNEQDGKTVRNYWTSDCVTCVIKHRCCTGKERRIKRLEHESILERVQKRLDDDPTKIPLRSRTVEHPFGTIKAGWARRTSR